MSKSDTSQFAIDYAEAHRKAELTLKVEYFHISLSFMK